MIGTAYAQATGQAGQGDSLLGLLPIVLMFVILYFLMIRPQMKKAKEHKSMLDALAKGDEVVSAGGIVGKVSKVGDSYVTLEVGQKGEQVIEMQFQKAAIQTLLPKGTIKAI